MQKKKTTEKTPEKTKKTPTTSKSKSTAKPRRKRKSTGWAKTKVYPHERHPAKYKRQNNDEVKYITFTHSDKVELDDGKTIQTVPLSENISPKEREKNNQEGKKWGENRSYAYPKVYKGKRSALGSETTEFEPTEFDKERINKMFEIFPEENVPVTGGKGQYRKRKKSKKK